jgi:serine protease inhibitor
MAARRAVFRADRPFVFVLRDIDSGLVLFMGRLSKPA